jgi:hypothetical protein
MGYQAAVLGAVILPLEIDIARARPERVTDCQEFLGACVSIVVIEEIAVPAMLGGGAPRDDIQATRPWISLDSVLSCWTNVLGCINPER